MNLSQIVMLEFAQIINSIVPIIIILTSFLAIYRQSERGSDTNIYLIILLVSLFSLLLNGFDRSLESYVLMAQGRDLLVLAVFGLMSLNAIRSSKLSHSPT